MAFIVSGLESLDNYFYKILRPESPDFERFQILNDSGFQTSTVNGEADHFKPNRVENPNFGFQTQNMFMQHI